MSFFKEEKPLADALLRIGTRTSQLALWQAEHVKTLLERYNPDLRVELVRIVTSGDKILDTPLAKIGGKGLFVKEIEEAMFRGEVDIAVHSMKDVPVHLPDGLHLPIVMQRENPHDAFVSNSYDSLDALPEGARVGTSSLRRQCQLAARRPDLEIRPLRGNVNTRLKKLDDGHYDAVILAAAGLIRLGFGARIRNAIAPEQSLPAIGQGAIGIECRTDDNRVNALIACLHHHDTADRVRAERAFNERLEGGCQVPIGGHAVLDGDTLWLRGLVGTPDGSELIEGEIRGPRAEAQAMGTALADELLGRGAARILKDLYDQV